MMPGTVITLLEDLSIYILRYLFYIIIIINSYYYILYMYEIICYCILLSEGG